ncbi:MULTISPECIES: thioredoxin family protein [Tenacibaculum]|jgi:thioredoxin 1|uniref:Thiol reductase thioredoxin n=3 Tax=Tenacibaculum TaxID=104267 RepID=A0A2G1BZ65_9FLAO|nr:MULTISPECIES: thioredoxin family protein [Tenacibaculum]PHO01520.1 thiol reductase thioredoxin [Rhodobacteraceae bacterium 4F10]AZJ35125.1 thioredoxin [Tenacibaculum singaporense]MDE1207287.1 thioredoxin family protein [Tenacibaculum larymnensis]MDP2541185.1 thioredoxin family protein [Tenacibaculum discolor]NVK09510.1 thioredoxin family protein [Tenacibaculum sp.]
MVQELSQDNLSEVVAGNKKVVVQFSATWCGNCRIMKPKFKKLSSENEDMVFVIADAEKFPESRKLADVSNLPTFATFIDGKFVNQTQTNKFDVLKDLVNEVA